jgi:hypothetical protein
VLGIHGKQGVQNRGTTAGQTDDEERFADFLARNARIELPISLHEEPRTQQTDKIGPKDNSSDKAELRFTLTGIQQSRQALEKVASAKIVESATALCRFDQINRAKGAARNSALVQQRSAAIQQSHWQDRAGLIDRGG